MYDVNNYSFIMNFPFYLKIYNSINKLVGLNTISASSLYLDIFHLPCFSWEQHKIVLVRQTSWVGIWILSNWNSVINQLCQGNNKEKLFSIPGFHTPIINVVKKYDSYSYGPFSHSYVAFMSNKSAVNKRRNRKLTCWIMQLYWEAISLIPGVFSEIIIFAINATVVEKGIHATKNVTIPKAY